MTPGERLGILGQILCVCVHPYMDAYLEKNVIWGEDCLVVKNFQGVGDGEAEDEQIETIGKCGVWPRCPRNSRPGLRWR